MMYIGKDTDVVSPRPERLWRSRDIQGKVDENQNLSVVCLRYS